MEKCKLCRKQNADKKGSHIVPHYLLKRVENLDGKKGRDYELGFTISKQGMKSHFGRSVNPQILDEIYGALSEDDIQKNKHPLVVDHFFCSTCEGRLATIENEYAKTINIIDSKTYESLTDIKVGLLFWTSIIWRLSINGKSGVKLADDPEEQLRCFLDNCIPVESLQELRQIDFSKYNNLSYKLARCSNLEEAKFVFFHPDFSFPYLLFIDEYILAFTINRDYRELNNKHQEPLNTILLKAIENSPSSTNENIEPFDKSDFVKIQNELIQISVTQYLEWLIDSLDKIHQISGGTGTYMPLDLKQEILDELVCSEQKLARKYTIKEKAKIIYDKMMQSKLGLLKYTIDKIKLMQLSLLIIS